MSTLINNDPKSMTQEELEEYIKLLDAERRETAAALKNAVKDGICKKFFGCSYTDMQATNCNLAKRVLGFLDQDVAKLMEYKLYDRVVIGLEHDTMFEITHVSGYSLYGRVLDRPSRLARSKVAYI